MLIFPFLFACQTKIQSTITEDTANGADTAIDTATESDTSSSLDNDEDGFSADDGDCDDTDPTIFPDAIDFPDDGIDQNCDDTDPHILSVLDGLANPSFENESTNSPGKPADWSNLGESYLLQYDNTNIFNITGDTGEIFRTRTEQGAALKIWGDYGNNVLEPGESPVYQQFLKTASWNPGNKNFWMDGWAMVHSTDPLLGQAELSLVIRCFSEYNGFWQLLTEIQGTILTVDSEKDVWHHLHSTGQCGANTNIVQAMVLFTQQANGSDHGAVFVDDIHFGEIEE